MGSMTRGRRVVSFAIAVVLGNLQLAGSCVDGVTPDCGDGSVCGPVAIDAASDGPAVVDGASDGPVGIGDASSDARDAADGG